MMVVDKKLILFQIKQDNMEQCNSLTLIFLCLSNCCLNIILKFCLIFTNRVSGQQFCVWLNKIVFISMLSNEFWIVGASCPLLKIIRTRLHYLIP